ncbi:MAG: hypothetical protein WDZ49_14120, partial [Litorilinea sp.]
AHSIIICHVWGNAIYTEQCLPFLEINERTSMLRDCRFRQLSPNTVFVAIIKKSKKTNPDATSG